MPTSSMAECDENSRPTRPTAHRRSRSWQPPCLLQKCRDGPTPTPHQSRQSWSWMYARRGHPPAISPVPLPGWLKHLRAPPLRPRTLRGPRWVFNDLACDDFRSGQVVEVFERFQRLVVLRAGAVRPAVRSQVPRLAPTRGELAQASLAVLIAYSPRLETTAVPRRAIALRDPARASASRGIPRLQGRRRPALWHGLARPRWQARTKIRSAGHLALAGEVCACHLRATRNKCC